MRDQVRKSVMVAAGALALSLGMAQAAIILDDEAVGFVGKGDVQLMFGWNNAQLQACATATPVADTDAGCLSFFYEASSTVVTEVSWVCTNDRNENTQERERTTTTTSASGGVSAAVARVRNQVTGFNLNGGELNTTSSSETAGPPLNSCPSGPWSLTTPAGDPEVISTTASRTLTVTDTRDGTSYTVELD